MKFLKGFVITVLIIVVLIVAALFIIPIAFKDKLVEVAKTEINKTVDAKVDFGKFNLSLFKNFPDATMSIKNITLTGVGEFENDTLVSGKELSLVFNLKSLFSDQGYELKKLMIDEPRVFAHVLENGNANWDIVKDEDDEDGSDETESDESTFKLQLRDVKISNGHILYLDKESDMKVLIDNLAFALSGDLSADKSLLKTNIGIGELSLWMDKAQYFSKMKAEIQADINADLNEMIFTFSDNRTKLNALPFSFEGWFAMFDEGYDMDLTLKAEDVDFKSILSIVPVLYANSFESIKADGEVDLKGNVKGLMIGEDYPSFNFDLKVSDAWFQYPDLPKSVKDINIAANVASQGGSLDNTIVSVPVFKFNLGGNPFSAIAKLSNLMTDPDMKLNAVGKLDLGMLKDVYPLENGVELNGVLDMNMDLNGKMSYYETSQFDRFKFAGNLSIKDLLLKYPSLEQDLAVSNADMVFNNQYVNLNALKVNVGKNDFSANGRLENFIPYIMDDKTLKAQLNLHSTYLNLNDFMSSENETADAETEDAPVAVIPIPENIDFTLQANLANVIFDKMELTDAKGLVKIADEELKLQNVGVQAFGGNLILNGIYNTQNIQEPKLDMDVAIDNVEFIKIFSQVETLQKFAPILSKATGRFSSKIKLNSLLSDNMFPDLASLFVDGSFSTSSVGIENVPALNALASNLKFDALKSLSLKDLSLLFNIENGKLHTKPFNINAGDVKMQIGGATGLDKSIEYKGSVQLPDKVNLGKLSTVNFTIGGTFDKPAVKLDLEDTINEIVGDVKASIEEEVNKQVDAIKDKAKEEAEKQKQKLIEEAEKQAEIIKSEAKKAGERLVEEAQKTGNQLVEKAENPILKKIAEESAKKGVEEAQKQADRLYKEAEERANQAVEKAKNLDI